MKHVNMEMFFDSAIVEEEREKMLDHIARCAECGPKWLEEREKRKQEGILIPGIVYEKREPCPSEENLRAAVDILLHIKECSRCFLMFAMISQRKKAL